MDWTHRHWSTQSRILFSGPIQILSLCRREYSKNSTADGSEPNVWFEPSLLKVKTEEEGFVWVPLILITVTAQLNVQFSKSNSPKRNQKHPWNDMREYRNGGGLGSVSILTKDCILRLHPGSHCQVSGWFPDPQAELHTEPRINNSRNL